MARKPPSYRLHKASGQAVVTLGGKDCYLGRYGTRESRAEYARLVAEWETGGRSAAPGASYLVDELLADYMEWAQVYYRKNGRPSPGVEVARVAVRSILLLYSGSAAADFGPLALRALQGHWVGLGLARSTVNAYTNAARAVFKWGVGRGRVPPGVLAGLKAVEGLKRGRSAARETEPVTTVPDAHVAAVLPRLSDADAAMVRLMDLTGMRPGEVVRLRGRDLDRSGAVWWYTPTDPATGRPDHKMSHRGKSRAVAVGPRAQAVLGPWLGRAPSPDAYCFPRRDGTPHPPKQLGTRVAWACLKAGVPRFGVNRLRHNAATRLRRHFGVEAARAALGHSSAAVTEIYAEVDRGKAAEAARAVG